MKLKRTLCLLLAMLLLLPLALPAAAADPTTRNYDRETQLGYALAALGLFQGYSGTDLGLDDAPTRTQALVMMLRLMGLEQDALAENSAPPFEDVPADSWAAPYVGYAYAHGLTRGQSETLFGGDARADARTYLTFVLRALGYEEGENGDFRWSSPVSLAQKAGIAPDTVRFSDFRRADVVTVSYAALAAERKGQNGETLAQSLIARGVFDASALGKYYDPDALTNRAMASPWAENVTEYYNSLRVREGIDISGLPLSYHNGVALIGDAGYELFGFIASNADRTAAQIAAGAAAVEGKARVFGIIVPNRLGAVLSYEDGARLCRSEKDETETIAYFNAAMGDKAIGVDAITNLRLHNDEYIFFRTDHHWTALGSYYAYEAWAKAAGKEPVPLENFDTKEYTGHLGLFNELCGHPAAMRANPDTVVAYMPRSSFTCEPENAMDFSGWDYNTFLGGDRAITTIVNNDIPDESACVLVKDSYGNPFAVWLTQHYHTVYVLDYRYYRNLWDRLTFSQFADEKGVEDFIILLPMTLSMNPYTANCLALYCQ